MHAVLSGAAADVRVRLLLLDALWMWMRCARCKFSSSRLALQLYWWHPKCGLCCDIFIDREEAKKVVVVV
jgi:hypothetical protein